MLTSLVVDPINHFIHQKVRVCESLKLFSGQTVRVQLFPVVEFNLVINDEGKLHLVHDRSEVDTILSIPAWKLPQLLMPSDRTSESVTIIGDKCLGNEVLNLIKEVNAEYILAQELSKTIGDISTNRMIQAGKAFCQWSQRNCDQTIHSILEFSTEEKQFLVKSKITHEFIKEIEKLNHSIDRLEARINHLTNQGN